MEILKKSVMPNGTQIQLEIETRDDEPLFHIGAYPIAKNASMYDTIKKDKPFRLILNFKNEALANLIFKALEKGEITLEDLPGYFHNGSKDAYYLGIIDNEPEW